MTELEVRASVTIHDAPARWDFERKVAGLGATAERKPETDTFEVWAFGERDDILELAELCESYPAHDVRVRKAEY